MKAFFFTTLFASTLLMWAESRAQTGAVGIGTTTPQAQLHTTASVRHDTLAGIGARAVFADAAGRLFAKPNNFLSNYASMPIPDSGCNAGNGAFSSIVVAGLPAIQSASIRVRVNIAHAANYHLRVLLEAPTGQVLQLINNGSGGGFTNTIFSDAATTYIYSAAPPYSGHYLATGSMYPTCTVTPSVGNFSGFGSGGSIVPNGTWRLRAYDVYPGQTGTLLNWSITFGPSDSISVSPVPLNVIPKGGPLNLVASSLYNDSGRLGINVAVPHAELQFPNTILNRKIVLHEAFNNNHRYFGFGINDYQLRYQVGSSYDNHVFYAGANDTTSTELMRITGTGRVGIGVEDPHAQLHLANGLANRKLILSEYSNDDHQFTGLGANSGALRYQVASANDNHIFYSGTVWSASTELLRITGNGRVGIRNSFPHAELQLSNSSAARKIILTELVDNDHQFMGFGADANTLRYQIPGTGQVHEFQAATSASTSVSLMRLWGNGHVEFGGATPQIRALVEINAGRGFTVNNYRYMNPSEENNVAGNFSANLYSLYTAERIWCNSEINVTSDVRTKNHISSSQPSADLALVNRLRVVDYNYIDRAAKGNTRVKGFLAQEVEAVMPDAITKNTGVVPNIYAKAEAVQYDANISTLAVTMKSAHGLKTGDTVKLITDAGDKLVPVVAVKDSLHFTVGEWNQPTDWAFIYGTQVHDLRNLDYNKIFSAGISAIQELSREVEDLKKTNAGLQTSVSALQVQMADVMKAVGTTQTVRR